VASDRRSYKSGSQAPKGPSDADLKRLGTEIFEIMPLKTITTLPPGGFPYKQKEMTKERPWQGPFQNQVAWIVDFRRGNNLPGADAQTAASDLDAYTCQRLGNDPRFCIDPSQKKTLSQSSELPVVPPAGLVASTVAGLRAIKDAWVGEGKEPVEQALAQHRADICVKECSDDPQTNKEHSHNRIGGFFNKVKAVVAQAILEQRREKLNLGLKVEGEDKLGTCDICGCNSELKVWTPLDTIFARAVEPPEAFPKHCWYRQEVSSRLVQPPKPATL
jgi:hypothetical protein